MQKIDMQEIERLKKAHSLSDLANLIGYKPSALSFIAYKLDNKYINIDLPKKNGGTRIISVPETRLKEVQKRLSKLFYKCVDAIENKKIPILPYKHIDKKERIKEEKRFLAKNSVSHGFRKGLSITSNASLHEGKRYVFNIDLEDFFGTINFGRVRGFFIKDKDFNLNPKVASLIAHICCYDHKLPQGSPTSPIISNLIGNILDTRLLQLSKKYRCTYSRYVDDITFSTNQKIFPENIAYQDSTDGLWKAGVDLNKIIQNTGFLIQQSKTRMQYQDSRQMVTGLVVNKKVNTRSEYYRIARSMCNALFTKGNFSIPWKKLSTPPIPHTAQQLEGILNYIYEIKKYKNKFSQDGYRKSRHDGIRTKKQKADDFDHSYPPLNRTNNYYDECHKVAIDGIKNLYGKFLFFKYFIALQKPLIFCEGKTDNAYLKSALKVLNSDLKNNIFFFNRTDKISELMKMAEGISGMKYISLSYQRMSKKFIAIPVPDFPVIMIADNDTEGQGLINAFGQGKLKELDKLKDIINDSTLDETEKLKKILENKKIKIKIKTYDGYKKYIEKEEGKFYSNKKIINIKNTQVLYIQPNLYVFTIPKIQNINDCVIEDYFPTSVLNVLVNGKSFDYKNNNYNKNTHYGKEYFVRHVVSELNNPNDFQNFSKIFDIIQGILLDYTNKKETPK